MSNQETEPEKEQEEEEVDVEQQSEIDLVNNFTDILNEQFDDDTIENISANKNVPRKACLQNNDDNNNNNDANEEKITYEGNIDIRDVVNDPRPLRIYLDGVFDMAHYGHYRLFKQIKDHFPNAYVIVGVSSDEETCRLKGQTLMDENERAESMGHCKWVNEVIMPCPWIITQEFIDKHKIDFIAHDGEAYVSANHNDIYDFVKKQGKFIATQRTDGISTTDLINRIIKRYNEFVLRNLQRGASREELNLSWTRQKRIELQAELAKKRQDSKKVVDKATQLVDNVKEWMEDPGKFVDGFLNIFGPRGKIANKARQEVQKMKEDFASYAQFAPM